MGKTNSRTLLLAEILIVILILGAVYVVDFKRSSVYGVRELVHPSQSVREAALIDLKKAPDALQGEITPYLISIVRRGHIPDAIYAIEAMAAMKESASAAIPMLFEIFRGGNPQLSPHAIWALGQIGENSVPIILSLLNSKDPETRVFAVLALEKIEIGSAPGLARALSDPDRFVRLYSAQALGEINPKIAKYALPSLRSALTDIDPDVRAAAKASLWAIRKRSVK